jgi:hypothetical protein
MQPTDILSQNLVVIFCKAHFELNIARIFKVHAYSVRNIMKI